MGTTYKAALRSQPVPVQFDPNIVIKKEPEIIILDEEDEIKIKTEPTDDAFFTISEPLHADDESFSYINNYDGQHLNSYIFLTSDDTHIVQKTGNIFPLKDKIPTSTVEETYAVDTISQCDICKKTYKNLSNLKNHMMKYHILKTTKKRKVFSCKSCVKKFCSKLKLGRHTCSFKCYKCPNRFNNLLELNQHQKIHCINSIQCPKCKSVFDSQQALIHHLQFVHKDDLQPTSRNEVKVIKKIEKMPLDVKCTKSYDKNYRCKVCSKVFPNFYMLRFHRKLRHDDLKTISDNLFECDYCDKEFPIFQRLINHRFYHQQNTTKLLHACEDCEKQFNTPRQLSTHRSLQMNENPPYACEICYKMFIRRKCLHEHQMMHTIENRNPKFECDKCDKKFVLEQNLINHAKVHLY